VVENIFRIVGPVAVSRVSPPPSLRTPLRSISNTHLNLNTTHTGLPLTQQQQPGSPSNMRNDGMKKSSLCFPSLSPLGDALGGERGGGGEKDISSDGDIISQLVVAPVLINQLWLLQV
jgi:hypothetical protein